MKILKMMMEKKASQDKIKFNEVSVFFFKRTQGLVSIPRDGNFTIGMEGKHSVHQKWRIEDDNDDEVGMEKSQEPTERANRNITLNMMNKS
jgi:hypothetical protein